jgi:hypothetical protein
VRVSFIIQLPRSSVAFFSAPSLVLTSKVYQQHHA